MDRLTASRESSRGRSILAQIGIDLRAGETAPALVLFLTFFLLITFQYTSKTVRQATFIDSVGAEKLPFVYLFIALVSYPFLRAYGRVAERARRDRLVAATCLLTAASMVVFWWLFRLPSPAVAFAFYVVVSVIIVVLASQFWSLASHVFDARQAKRLFAFVGAGGLLGGVLGGQAARLATKYFETRSALLLGAAILVAVALIVRFGERVYRIDDERRVAGARGLAALDEAKSGMELLRQSRHVQWLAALTVLTVTVAQIVDLQFNWAVQRATTSLAERTAFFGNVYSIIGVVAFGFQLVFTARILRRFGVGASIRVLPVTLGLGTLALIGAAAGAPEALLVAALVLKTGENGVRYSLDQAAREQLYVPIPSRARVRAKAFIDVSVQRVAEGAAAILLLPVTFGLMTPAQAGSLSLALIGVWLAVTAAARREYVGSLRAGLKRTRRADHAIDLSDATTLELVQQSLASSDSRQVIHALHLLERHDPNLVPALLLHHEAAAVKRATLRALAGAARTDALPLVERCLSDGDAGVRSEAVAALARLQGTDASSLMLPYLASDDPGLVAAAVVAVYNDGDGELRRRAAEVLAVLLKSEDPVARAEAANALGYLESADYDASLTLLLGDPDRNVVRATMNAVRRRTYRHGANPMHAPALISLLADRRLKHEARRALVAFGEPAIGALLHFMNSADERLWVRRAIPKTIAMIGGREAVAALASSLPSLTDSFLLRKTIESLTALTTNTGLASHRAAIVAAAAAQAKEYFRALALLAALGSVDRARLSGTSVVWDDETYPPSLLESLLCERMRTSVANLFGLLALLHDRQHVRDAHRSLTSGDPGLFVHAAEYLDNVLSSDLKAFVVPLIDELPLAQRLAAARALFGIRVSSRVEAIGELVEEGLDQRGEAASWGAAALYEVYVTRADRLYPWVEKAKRHEAADPFVRETAEWIARRLGGTVGAN